MSQFYVGVTAGSLPPTVPLTFVANDGTTSQAAANIENLVGNNTANNGFATYTTASGNTHLIHSYGPYKWVVNPIAGVGTHQTITSAMASASSGDDIFIVPGNYIENFTLKGGVNLIGPDGLLDDRNQFGARIQGKITFDAAAHSTISNLFLITNGDYVFESPGGLIGFENCYFDLFNFSGINITAGGASTDINIRSCWGGITDSVKLFNNASGGNFGIYDSSFFTYGSNPNSSTSSAGLVTIRNSSLQNAITCTNGAGLLIENSYIDSSENNTTALTITTSTLIQNSIISSGSATAITIAVGGSATITNSTISSSNAAVISGAGTVIDGGIIYPLASTVTTTTQTPLVRSNDAVKLVRPGSYPYTVIAQDAIISVDTSSAANTVNLPASPVNGQKHTIKDRSANAATNNITVSGNGHNIVGTTSAASQTISLNGASVTYIYDTSVWLAV